MRPQASTFALLAVLALVAGPARAEDERQAVANAVRRIWTQPALALSLGLRQPPPEARQAVLRSLEWTVKTLKLDSVDWTPSATARAGGPVRGDLVLAVSGRMPSSTAVLDCSIRAAGIGFERAALERRGGLEIVSPGPISAVLKLPFEMLAFLNKGARFASRDGKLEVRGKGKVLFFDLSFKLIGHLDTTDRVHVNLVPDALSLASIPAPGPVRRAMVDTVNPVFCVDSAMGPLMHFAVVEVSKMTVEKAGLSLEATGRLRPPSDPEPGPPHHPPRGKGHKEKGR